MKLLSEATKTAELLGHKLDSGWIIGSKTCHATCSLCGGMVIVQETNPARPYASGKAYDTRCNRGEHAY